MPESSIDHAARLRPYLPNLLIGWLAEAPGTMLRALEGTVVFVDISGFTKMSERLARKGKVGAEEVTDVIGAVFARLLAVAYGAGGGLVKFGGDALLLFFSEEDHPARGARAAVGMRKALRDIGPIETSAGKVALRMSIGIHSGTFHFFLVGDSHRELVITGPAATETASMEGEASAGEILVSRATAGLLPDPVIGKAKGDGRLLRSAPRGLPRDALAPEPILEGVDLLSCIPQAIREHVLSGQGEPEHRRVTVAFVHFDGVDRLVSDLGSDVVAYGLDHLVSEVQAACEKNGVTFLGSDVDKDGGKIILVSGAPQALGDDEERMLLTLRSIADAGTTIPVRIGVNSGPVFVGDVGPSYRRTYTVMGDAVNLAARVMAKAQPGEILATEPVLRASGVRFDTGALDPFMVKGKKHPVVAHRVGRIVGSSRTEGLDGLALVGRTHELDVLRAGLEGAKAGRGTLVEVAGEAGIGKSRLIREIQSEGSDIPWLVVSCEPYEASTPYFPFRPLLRGLLGIPEDIGRDEAVTVFTTRVEQACPELLPWLPLLAVPLDLEIPDTPEVASLEERFRRERLEAAMGDLLVEFSGGPSAAVIEDAQWMDETSAELLRAIALRMGELALLVLVARRDPDAVGGEDPDGHRVTLALQPLSSEESIALIEGATEDAPLTPHAVDQLVQRSGGGPRFLKSLIRAMIESGGSIDELPGSVEGLVLAQIDRLPARDRMRLRLLSVLGMSFAEELAVRLLEEEGLEAGPDAWRALERFLGPEERGGLRFRNGLIRDVAYESLPFRRRRELHARVGATIERDAGADADDEAERLAFHFLHSDDEGKAWRYARIAAARATALYANVEARDFYLQALEAARRLRDAAPAELAYVAEALGDVRMRLGEYDDAVGAYRIARRKLATEPVAQARLLAKEARASDRQGRYTLALRTLKTGSRLLEGVRGLEAARERARLAVRYGGIRQAQGRYAEAIRWCREALEEAEAADELDAMAHAFYLMDWAYVSLGRADEAVYSERALELYERLGDLARHADVVNNMGGFAYWQGRWDEARALYERARGEYAKTGNTVDAASCSANVGEILLNQGHLAEADRVLRDALRVFRASGVRAYVAWATGRLGVAACRAGETEAGGELLEEAASIYREVGEADGVFEMESYLAERLVQLGHATDAARRALELTERTPGGSPSPMLLRILGEAQLRSGMRDESLATFDRSLRAGRDQGADHEVAMTLDALLRAEPEGPASADRRAERDALFERLGIVAVLGPGPEARAG